MVTLLLLLPAAMFTLLLLLPPAMNTFELSTVSNVVVVLLVFDVVLKLIRVAGGNPVPDGKPITVAEILGPNGAQPVVPSILPTPLPV